MSNNTMQKVKFSQAIQTPTYQKLVRDTLGDPKRSARFIAAVSSAVAVNQSLQACTANSILTGALLGESLNLSPSPQLGQYYLVPFKIKSKYNKETGETIPEHYDAQFILGYKGYLQLAIRSGYYKKINVIEIKDGELIGYDPLTETIECSLIDDFEMRENAPTIGYYAHFVYLNGFEKSIYWSKQKMLSHADKYSPAFHANEYERLQNGEIPERDMWKYSSFWYKDFDGMAKKTLLRQLISKWGVMSLELQSAVEADNKVIERNENGKGFVPTEVEIEEPETVETVISEEPQRSESDEVDINDL
ncbi:MAG: recombinase RecT [Pseudoruminococcus massiliensis]|uniref:recombinase RecT n=1 Tax=Pseudoruminococcus massiliensis TaxID=2086583 RepID=UPI0039919CDF